MIKEYVFKKKDGLIRILRGTTDMNYAKKNFSNFKEPTGEGRKTPDHIQLVWDIENNDYRSFIKENLIYSKNITKKVYEKLIDSSQYWWKKTAKRIHKGKTPYFILLILAKENKPISVDDIWFKMHFYHTTKHQRKNVNILLNSFYDARLVAKINDNFVITDEGERFFNSI